MAKVDVASPEYVENFIHIEPGETKVKIVPRDQMKSVLNQWRRERDKFQNLGNDPSCWGCLFSLGEFITDPTGKKRENAKDNALNTSVAEISLQLEKTIPLIENGLHQLENNATPFVESLPKDSPAKKLTDKFGPACLCEITQLSNGTTIALLRGETKKYSSSYRHRSGAEEHPNSQRSFLITSSGEIFNIEAQTYSTGRDRRDLVAETSPLRSIFNRHLNNKDMFDRPDTKRKESYLSAIEMLIEGTRKYDQSTVTPVPVYANQYDRLILSKFDANSQTAGKDLKHHFLLSQKRAITVAYDIGVEDAKKNSAYTAALE